MLFWSRVCLLSLVDEEIVPLQVDAIRPSEADDVALVSCCGRDVGVTANYIVFSQRVSSVRKF
jgi:hypothetical protein